MEAKGTQVCHPNTYYSKPRDIFVTEHTGTLFWKFFLRRMQAGMAFQNLFPVINIINTPLL
jgi:hypothetical protein